ncbi:MAG: hypothetical protein ACLSA6_17765 [Holdemania massiliensis]
MELFNEIFSQFNEVLWGPPLIILLLGTHCWMTLRTRGVQRWIFKGIKLSVTPDKTEGDISPFAALTTALASPSEPATSSVLRPRSFPADRELCYGLG